MQVYFILIYSMTTAAAEADINTIKSSSNNDGNTGKGRLPARQMSLTQEDLAGPEDVARIMREEDAQLLESMRFEQSCSTGETPVFTSIESNLDDIEDMPLISEATVEQHQEVVNSKGISHESSSSNTKSLNPNNNLNNVASSSQRSVSLEGGDIDANNNNDMSPTKRHYSESSLGGSTGDAENPVVYRQCLSGEIKSIRTNSSPSKQRHPQAMSTKQGQATSKLSNLPAPIVESQAEEDAFDDDDDDDDEEEALPGGEETTISSTCCSHNATVTPSIMTVASAGAVSVQSTTPAPADQQQTVNSVVGGTSTDTQKRDSTTDRRMKEAVQFAQAVGEMPPMDINNDLCIIEEYDDDDTDDDDDGDDGTGTVIRLDELGSQIGSVHDHGSLVDTGSVGAMVVGGATAVTDMVSIITGGDDKTVNEQQQQQQQNYQQRQPPSDIPRVIIKRKSRPQWPLQLQLPGWTFSHLDTSMHANREKTVQDFVYHGIVSNPPEIVSRGISRGNHVQLHRKAWLEVSDKYHRYGKNLRLYYRYWESLGFPTNMFFDWLDSKGEAAGQPLPNLEETCPRSKLDSDTVLYITNPEVTEGYSLKIVTVEGRARFVDVDGEIVRTGPEGWIFVLRDGVIYGAEKITSINGQSKQRFHHSSFFGGKAVAAAGIFITDEEGFLTRLYPHSGHYRPREAHMQRLLYFLYHQGVDLRTFEMDVQQIMHVCRETDGDAKKEKKEKKKEKVEKEVTVDGSGNGDGGKKGDEKEKDKKKKIDSLQLWPAVSVACYVAHKAHFIGDGIFSQIHQIRNANVASVSEALDLVNGKKQPTTCPKVTIAE